MTVAVIGWILYQMQCGCKMKEWNGNVGDGDKRLKIKIVLIGIGRVLDNRLRPPAWAKPPSYNPKCPIPIMPLKSTK